MTMGFAYPLLTLNKVVRLVILLQEQSFTAKKGHLHLAHTCPGLFETVPGSAGESAKESKIFLGSFGS